MIYDVYDETEIPKGRAFGSEGGIYTADYINEKMGEIGLEDNHTEQMKHIDGVKKNYTSMIDVVTTNLTVNNNTYPYMNDIPIKEFYPAVSAWPDRVFGDFDYTTVFTNSKLYYNDLTDFLPQFWANNLLNISDYTNVNDISPLLGNVTYITNSESVPDEIDQYGKVFLFNETEEGQDILDNLSIPLGCILIDTAADYSINSSTADFTMVRINETDKDNILEILENYSTVIVDDFTGDLTFSYDFNQDLFPSSEYVVIDRIPDHWELKNKTSYLLEIYTNNYERYPNLMDYIGCYYLHTALFRIIAPRCQGYVLYNTFDQHAMWATGNNWNHEEDGDWLGNHPYALRNFVVKFPALPTFMVNYSCGNFLNSTRFGSSGTTISGDICQKFYEETTDSIGVEAYNVIGNLTIEQSPNDEIVIISGRYDGMWGQTPGDSGIGVAIMLAIAKYFVDNNITPKYNLTFLFDTAEEYGLRGAQHYHDSLLKRWEKNGESENIRLWLGTDSLGFYQKGVPVAFQFGGPEEGNNASLNRKIAWAIANDTQYDKRTNYSYGFEPLAAMDSEGTEEVVWRDLCDTICFVKENKSRAWDRWHSTGQNYTEGDSLKYTDYNDVNITFELIWNVTKYFTVNPDCWFDNTDISVIDSDDADNLVDTISFSFDVTSTLPHDFAMVNYSLTKVITDNVVTFENINFTVNRSAKSKTVNITLPSGESPGFYVFRNDLYNSTGRINETIDPVNDSTNQTYISGFCFLYPYNNNVTPPDITNVSATPDPVGYGYNVTISADVTSNMSSIDKVTVNITYPDEITTNSYNMTNTTGDTYQYIFNDTWQHGQYDYVIWAKDVNGNESGSSQYSFNVSINATISVCTIKDSYGDNETINLTDPPSNPPLIGYELLDDGQVLRIWNKYDSYYFDTDNGIQFTNHYNEYWSHNVLMLGYYNNDEWNLIYRVDNLSGFNQEIETDDTTYVNATLWKNLNYKGYDFRLAIRYHLGVDDNELTVIPYIKNIDDEDIPYNLGFAWEIKDIQIDMTTSGDFIEINGTSYFLNQTLNETYKNMGNPCYYIREDINGEESESLYLRWDENLDDIVQVKSRDGQYNAPVTLGVKIGTLDVGQEKQTSLFWHDAAEKIYYFNSYETAEAWATSPGNMVDGILSNYASTGIDEDIELCDGNNCSGSDLGTISKVELRVYGYYSTNQRDIILIPVFDGIVEGLSYNYPTESTANWSQWFDITNDPGLSPSGWNWNVVKDLDCKVTAENDWDAFTLYCSKVEMRVTYTPNNYPVISDPVPANGTTSITIAPMLNITVSDPDGDSMNITWLSNSSGSWVAFGSNSSVGNGTYHQTMSNASVNGEWWYWKVNVSDGSKYIESSVYNFFTGYESKITNTGSTHFKGYLLMQVQFYNETSQSWVVADDTVNESSPRTFPWNDPGGSPGQHILALDTIFNGLVNTANLSGFGNGTYRVYACLRDPDGNVLFAGGSIVQGAVESEYLETWYEFTITFD